MLRSEGQLWDVFEGEPQVRVRLVCSGEEVLAATGVYSCGEHLDACHHRKQPLCTPQDYQGKVLVQMSPTHTWNKETEPLHFSFVK